MVARIGDVVCSMKPGRLALPYYRREHDSLRERSLDLIAKAMQQCFEGAADEAVTLLLSVREEVENRRDSRNRMRYILANAAALALILALWFLDGPATAGEGLFSGVLGPIKDSAVRPIDVLALGAIGAFFAVSCDIKAVKVNNAITLPEMFYAGFVRVPIGVIAAAVVIMLISGQWILGSIDEDVRPWSYYLFGFLAGFSELFVPNFLKDVERTTTTKRPEPSLPAA
jgi:hypothetical protein